MISLHERRMADQQRHTDEEAETFYLHRNFSLL